jgi:hypothetical protein
MHWRWTHIQDQTVETQCGVKRLEGVHDAAWRNSAERPGQHHHIKRGVRQRRRGHIRNLEGDLPVESSRC